MRRGFTILELLVAALLLELLEIVEPKWIATMLEHRLHLVDVIAYKFNIQHGKYLLNLFSKFRSF